MLKESQRKFKGSLKEAEGKLEGSSKTYLNKLKGSLKQSEMKACRELEGSLEIAQS